MIFGAAQPLRHLSPQNAGGSILREALAALAGDDEDDLRAVTLRRGQKLTQGRKSFLPPHSMQVDHGVGGGRARATAFAAACAPTAPEEEFLAVRRGPIFAAGFFPVEQPAWARAA